MSEAVITISAVDRTAAVIQGVQQRFSGLTAVAARVGAGLAGLAVTGAAAGAALLPIVQGIDRLADLADATGASVEALSAIESAALRAGGTLDSAAAAVLRLNQTLDAAGEDTPAARAIRNIGLQVEQLRAQDPALALHAVARGLAQISDTTERAEHARALFGRGLRETGPLLADLAATTELTTTVTAEQADEVAELMRHYGSLDDALTQTGRAFLNWLLPPVNDALAALGHLDEAVVSLADTVATTLSDAWRDSLDEMARWQRQLGALLHGDIAEVGRERYEGMMRRRQPAQAGAARVADPLEQPGAATPLTIRVPLRVPAAAAGRVVADDSERVFERLRAGLQSQLDATRDLSAQERLLLDLQRERAGSVTDAQRETLISLARELDLGRQLTEQEASRESQRQEAARAREQQLAEQLALETQVHQASGRADEERRAALDATLQRMRRLGQVTEQEAERAARAISGVQSEWDGTARAADRMSMVFVSSLGQMARGGGTLSQMIQALAQDVAQLVLQITVLEPLAGRLRAVFEGGGGGGGGGGGLLGGILGAIGGGLAGAAPAKGVTIVQNIGQIGSQVSRVDIAAGMRAASDQAISRLTDGAARGSIRL